MSYSEAIIEGVAGAGAGAGVLTGIRATKIAHMEGVHIAEGMMREIITMKVGVRGIGV